MDQKLKAPHIPAKAKSGICAALAAIGMFFAMAAVPLACDRSETKEVKPEKTLAELEHERSEAEEANSKGMTPEEHVARAWKLLEEEEALIDKGDKQAVEASRRTIDAGWHLDEIPKGHPLREFARAEYSRKLKGLDLKEEKKFGTSK